MTIPNEIGILGVILILIAYLLLQLGKMRADSLLYSVLNLLGSIGILYSLFFDWNLSAFIIEVAWILISLYGVIHFYQKKKTS